MDTKNVKDFGATGDGVTDDYLAIRGAIASAEADGGGAVYFPAGTYGLTKRERFCGILLAGTKPLTFYGDGIGVSTIKMLPSGAGGMSLFRLTSQRLSFRDLTFDGNRDVVQAVDEQTHLLQIETAAKHVSIEGCEFKNIKSDGIKIAGTDAATAIDNLIIANNTFLDCGRSGITCQRAFKNTRILGNFFQGISDQSIDFEPTGSGGPARVIIAHNIIEHSTLTEAVTICGVSGEDRATDIIFENNIIRNGTLFMVDCRNVFVLANRISAPDGKRCVQISRGHDNIHFVGNIITGGAGKDVVGLYIFAGNGRIPKGIHVLNNTIDVNATHGIAMEGVSNVVVAHNRITDVGNLGVTGLVIRAVGVPTKNIKIDGNQISGFNTGIDLQPSPESIADVSLVGNQFTHYGIGGKTGIRQSAPAVGKTLDRITMLGNHMGEGITHPYVS